MTKVKVRKLQGCWVVHFAGQPESRWVWFRYWADAIDFATRDR